MNWDLYVDESGNFAKDLRCLVGGFIVPEGSVTKELVEEWKSQIMAIPEINEMIQDVHWFYDHCKVNTYSTKRKQRVRSEIQYLVVKEYMDRIKKLGGKLVIFDNPSGIYNTDNTTNFLTILAKGLMALYYDWPEKNPVIRLHFASRMNVTYCKEKDDLPTSPTRVIEPELEDDVVIIPSQYVAQIRNLAFLQAGQTLLENETFSAMLDGIDILKDTFYTDEEGKKQQIANPLTIPCDYICNTLIKADSYSDEYQNRIKKLYRQTDTLIYNTDRPLSHAPQELLNWESDGNNGRILMRLISTNFPEPATSRFLRFFNAATVHEQKTDIAFVIKALYSKVARQETMEELAERLGRAIRICDQMENEQIRLELVANLLLYQESLYTHLGNQKQVSLLQTQFKDAIDKIEDDTVRDELIDISDNRRLVNLTDKFDYDTATSEFENIERYWNQAIEARQRRHRTATESPKYPIFGKTIGSYLQVLRHEIHQAAPEDKELYYSEAKDRFQQARDHLIDNEDISRFHQTACDIEAEMGHYQAAYNHLFLAATIEQRDNDGLTDDVPISSQSANDILKVSGYGGEKYPFLLQHYVRLLSLMYMSDSASKDAETILQPLISHINIQYGEEIRNPHPRTQIQWKTASALAFRANSSEKQHQLSAILFSKAVSALKQEKQAVFMAIAVGVLAEEAWHIAMNHVPGDASEIISQMKQLYQHYVSSLPSDKKDPFDKAFMKLPPEEMLKEKDKLLQASCAIGY